MPLTDQTTVDGIGHPIAVHPDGRTIAALVADVDGTGPVVLVDAATGARRAETDSRNGAARALVFTADGRLLATASGRSVVTCRRPRRRRATSPRSRISSAMPARSRGWRPDRTGTHW